MTNRDIVGQWVWGTASLLCVLCVGASCTSAHSRSPHAVVDRPNIIFILADDLGYGDLGCYGQKKIHTPRLDRMAAEGIRFTQFYAGSTVCAPSRSVLMTGLHAGHTRVRGNADEPGRQALRDEDVTVAERLKTRGYSTALIGKWGLGDVNGSESGLPNRQGFDYFYGYLNQHHAHNYYPTYLWRNQERVALGNVVPDEDPRGSGKASKRVQYSHDLFVEEALRWVRQARDEPFFLYLALTIPHANNEARQEGMEVPDYGPYAGLDWPAPQKGAAAMISRMDRDIGRLLDLLRELGIEKQTLVLFSSDNGPHREGGNDPQFFNSSGPLRGIKRDLYEGGIRVPTLAWWPGTLEAGTVSDHVGYQGDFLATAAELAGAITPAGLDSLSFLPTLLGEASRQKRHEYLYWEFYEQGGARAVRSGRWKAVRPRWEAPLELYDLESDLGETRNVAELNPQVAQELASAMEQAHTPDENWRVIRPKMK